ncbi:carboxylate--amine ligase [bacterium]|nr:carboxylate--amine ligase [bacterium]
MNIVFLSPHFPPQYYLFCEAVRKNGGNILGIGDAPSTNLRDELRRALADYYFVPNMNEGDALLRALAFLVHKHGKIDRLDSLNEHWLAAEAHLREDFNIPGLKPEDLPKYRSKTHMREVFKKAGVPCSIGEPYAGEAGLRAFVKGHGYPVVLKPDQGVGAARTFKLTNDDELASALATDLTGYVVEAFITGRLGSYDGLVDDAGHIVYETSHVYSAGIMDIVNQRLPMHYYSRREIPPLMRELGRKAVKAFALKGRFFHLEFFEEAGGKFRALEINVRPPGGFTTDMMNYASDIDVYDLWARMICGKDVSDFAFERKYLCANVSRRRDRRYARTDGEIRERFGDAVILHRDMPSVFSEAMGDEMYLVRMQDEEVLREVIAFIEEVED